MKNFRENRAANARKFFVVLLIFAVVGTQAIAAVNAFTFGYAGIGSEPNQGGSMVGTYYDLVVPDGYLATITQASVYMSNDSTAASLLDVQVGVYNGDTNLLLGTSEIFHVSATQWYNLTLDVTVGSGNYVLAVTCEDNGVWRYYDLETGYNSDYEVAPPPMPSQATWSDWGAYRLSLFVEYDFITLIADPTLVAVYTFGYLGVIVILLVMFWVKIPILMLAMGGLGITVSGGLWQSEYVVFTPFLQSASLVVSLLLIAYSYVIWRR